jgi:lysyl-tRNA synthetase class I
MAKITPPAMMLATAAKNRTKPKKTLMLADDYPVLSKMWKKLPDQDLIISNLRSKRRLLRLSQADIALV